MKLLLVSLLVLPSISLAAASGDLSLKHESVRFSSQTYLEGRTVRIYASVESGSTRDLRGVVKFLDGKEEIKGDQPVSVLAGKEDSVFVDWEPVPGEHELEIVLVPFDNDDDDPANNSFSRRITVLADTDRDGIPNSEDPDDDNDGVPDFSDAFPLDRSESVDSDGDRIGNNKDGDDDNDGTKDSEDALPLDATEQLDTDHDGIGNNADTDDDGDGLSDIDEIKQGTNPLHADTDGDQVNDKEDAWPLDPAKSRDTNKNGIPDAEDPDADSDGIPKTQDVNDSNLGVVIIITTQGAPAQKIASPRELVTFETTTSLDPDGEVGLTTWNIEGKKIVGPLAEAKFDTLGRHIVTVTVTDDKNEPREKSFSVYVVPGWLPWASVLILLLIFILAIFLVFSYSKRRRSRWQSIYETLDTIIKWLPDPKKK